MTTESVTSPTTGFVYNPNSPLIEREQFTEYAAAAGLLPAVSGVLFGERYQTEAEKAFAKGFQACSICGRAIKGATHGAVNTAYGSDIIDPSIDEGTPEASACGYSGWFAVGPECARKAGIKAYVREVPR